MARDLPEVRRALTDAGVFDPLAPYHPEIAGTIPLGLDTPESDVDLLCEAADADLFVRDILPLARFPGFSVHRKPDADPPAVVCRFRVGDLPVEVFAQPIPVIAQRAHRHMEVEGRLLAAAGHDAAGAIRLLKARGVKTEPAFAEHFALPGDPYAALLEMWGWSDRDLAAAAEQGRRVRTECMFCRIVEGDERASLVYEDTCVLGFMNIRQANPGHVLVVPRRHVPTVFDLDGETASRIGTAVAVVAQGVRSAFGTTDCTVWQSNGAAAGQEISHLHVHMLPRRPGDRYMQVYPPDAPPPPPRPRGELDGLAHRIRTALQQRR